MHMYIYHPYSLSVLNSVNSLPGNYVYHMHFTGHCSDYRYAAYSAYEAYRPRPLP